MQKLSHEDLYSLERYAIERPSFRARAIAHKRARTVHLGPHATLLFEDRLTVQYQVQEMLRTERIFERAGIREELDAYNPLIPDGANLKATLLFEYEDPAQRKRELARLGGIEHRFYAEVAGLARTTAVADEDLGRSSGEKTSAVHFLRYEFDAAMIASLRDGGALRLGIDDDRMRVETALTPLQREALLADFD